MSRKRLTTKRSTRNNRKTEQWMSRSIGDATIFQAPGLNENNLQIETRSNVPSQIKRKKLPYLPILDNISYLPRNEIREIRSWPVLYLSSATLSPWRSPNLANHSVPTQWFRDTWSWNEPQEGLGNVWTQGISKISGKYDGRRRIASAAVHVEYKRNFDVIIVLFTIIGKNGSIFLVVKCGD